MNSPTINPSLAEEGAKTSLQGSFLRGKTLWPVIILLYVCATLFFYEPITKAGFFSDDAVTCNWKNNLQLTGQTGFTFCVNQFKGMMKFQGRFAPVYNFVNTPMLLFIGDDLALYRVVHFVFTVASLMALAYLVNTLLADRAVGWIVALLFMSCTQIRSYHDSMTSFGFVLQWLLIFSSLSLCMLVKGIRENRLPLLVLSSVFYLIALLMTEFGLIIPVAATVILGIEGNSSWRVRLLRWMPFVAGSVGYVLITLALKPDLNVNYSGTSFGSLHDVPRTFLIQVMGTLPLTYSVFDPNHILHTNPAWVQDLVSLPSALAVLTCFGSLYFITGLITPKTNKHLILLAVLGIVFTIVPAVLLSGSRKYQTELISGLAYLPVYIQSAGYAMIVTSVICLLVNYRIASTTKRVLCAMSLALILLLSGAGFAVQRVSNSYVVASENSHWKNARELLGVALEHYTFDPPQNVTIVINSPWLNRWENSNFLFRCAGAGGVFISLNQFFGDLSAKSDPREYLNTGNFYYVDYPPIVQMERPASLILGRIRSATMSKSNPPGGPGAIMGDRDLVVVRSKTGESGIRMINIEEGLPGNPGGELEQKQFQIGGDSILQGMATYRLFQVPRGVYELTTYSINRVEAGGINAGREFPGLLHEVHHSSSH